MQPPPLRRHYLRHLERMQAANRTWLPGWNFAAFVHSTGWFWYHRMYAWSLLNLIAPVVALFLLVFVAQWFLPEGSMGTAMAVVGIVYLLLVFVLLPLYADSLYLYRLRREGKAPQPPSAFTALGALALIVVPAYVAYVTAQAQLEYAPRERASEGLARAQALRTPVAEFYANQGRLPNPAEAAKFAERDAMKFTQSVGWDAGRRAIVVALGERDGGRRFEIAALEKEGALEWACRTIDFDAKYLPASCR
jgi:type IV pilus assembly protein PilA